MPNKIVIIECCNFIDYPTGGHLTFATQMLDSFNQELVLLGMTTDKSTIGKWVKTKINGIEYDYFNYIYLPKNSKKPLIPLRLQNYLALRKYKSFIMKAGLKNVITQSFETAMAIRDFNFQNTCYRFPGTDNPLGKSRYKLARTFAFLYDDFFLSRLSDTNVILASATSEAIDALIVRSKGHLKKEKVKQFPTRVNTSIFYKKNTKAARKDLFIPLNEIIIVTTGRLAWFKGWKFMIDSFKLFQSDHPASRLLFVGNGEDFEKIRTYISSLRLDNAVYLVGFKKPIELAQYLNAADLFIMGSYQEGWSTSLLEAIACGTPACVTNFNSAKEIIEEGITGYVSDNHVEKHFVDLMNKGLSINREKLPRKIDIDKYSVSNLREDLLRLWQLI